LRGGGIWDVGWLGIESLPLYQVDRNQVEKGEKEKSREKEGRKELAYLCSN